MIHSLRTAARSAVEHFLVSTGVAARSRRKDEGRVAILAYHNVVPAGTGRPGDASLHLEVGAFGRQLDRLIETHRVVSLVEALEVPSDAGRPPPAAITFDDGYRGVLRHAVPELVERGLPATVFVCPGLLGADGFWWDRVSLAPGSAPAGWRERALGSLAGKQHAVLGAMDAGRPPEGCRPVTEDELLELAGTPGITLASHTWSHPNLTALPDEELAEELARPSRWLAERVPGAHLAGHVTFPYGLWDERVKAAAEVAGYRFQYRVEGGLARPVVGGPPLTRVLPRINVPAGVSVRGFELRTSGVLG